MDVVYIKKGRDIRLKGAAAKQIESAGIPSKVAVLPPDFRGLRPRLLIKDGDPVKVGTPLFEDKDHPEIKVVSPASGHVAEINRGEKRALLEIVIETDRLQEPLSFCRFDDKQIKNLSRQDIVDLLLKSGLWPCFRQRPFSKVAKPGEVPKSIFVQAMNTEPLALDIDFILYDQESRFRAGLDIISKLTQGDVHLCYDARATSKALTQSANINIKTHVFSGPHPTGNVSTHIHYIDPIHRGEVVWYIRAEDVLRVAALFLDGAFSPERFVAVTGEGAARRIYYKTIMGVPLANLFSETDPQGKRFISGNVLSGRNAGLGGYLGFYDSQITVIPEGGKREFLGWLLPGGDKYTFSRTFLSALKKSKDVSLCADENGGRRAIVLNDLYDRYVALDIMTYFLVRAIIAGEIEEAERLGILECDEEDFALCTFACPSKTDVGGIIRRGLDLIEKEG